MCECGEYQPLSLDEAVTRTAAVVRKFREAGVRVIRVGLCSSENLSADETYFAGPNHPAIGELCENQIYYEKILERAAGLALGENTVLKISVAPGNLSKAVGQRKRNKLLLTETLGIGDAIFTESAALIGYEISVGTEEGEKTCT